MAQVGLAAAALLGVLVVVAQPAAAAQVTPLYSVARDDDQLRRLDPANGSTLDSVPITIQGSTVQGSNGLATHPGTGVMYALVRLMEGFPPDRWLVTLDPSTGNASIVGNTGGRFAGIAFDSGGTLYAVTGDGEATLLPESLYTLSLADATPTFVTALGNGGFGEAIGFDPDDGFLYHASGFDDQVGGDTRVFEKIDLGTLVPTDIPLSGDGYSELTALVFYFGTFLGADTETGNEGAVLLSLTDTGVVQILGSTDHVAKGLAFGPPPPQLPGLDGRGIALLGLVLAAFGGATARVRRAGPGRAVS